MAALALNAPEGVPEITGGTDLARVLLDALDQAGLDLRAGDVLVIAQKVVSKAEARRVALAGVEPGPRARELAAASGKDPRLAELILRESRHVLRVKPGVIIVEHRLGMIMANAGIDQSNVGPAGEGEYALLLPLDPDASARALRRRIAERTGVAPGVLVIDSFGRPWRNGVTGTAIGTAGIAPLVDLRGRADRDGRALRVTQVAAADELAAAASLLMGQGAEGRPLVHVRGHPYGPGDGRASDLLRPRAEDLFR